MFRICLAETCIPFLRLKTISSLCLYSSIYMQNDWLIDMLEHVLSIVIFISQGRSGIPCDFDADLC